MENVSTIILAILAAAIPVVIIFFVIYRIRRKREDGTERQNRKHANNPTEKLKSVKESRLEEKGASGNNS
ncbi:hypothetical protein AB9P05_13610 [Roseivirga sp. BDSF3-8]|uniref:hypothetical protein n=1 Tax=Roseivirga sp. BDSF3-8 TaxID=3241598 RepID=UPI00353184E6